MRSRWSPRLKRKLLADILNSTLEPPKSDAKVQKNVGTLRWFHALKALLETGPPTSGPCMLFSVTVTSRSLPWQTKQLMKRLDKTSKQLVCSLGRFQNSIRPANAVRSNTKKIRVYHHVKESLYNKDDTDWLFFSDKFPHHILFFEDQQKAFIIFFSCFTDFDLKLKCSGFLRPLQTETFMASF